MRYRTSDAPWWLLAVLTGVPFGAVMGLIAGRQQHASPTIAVVVGVTSGVLFGVAIGSFAARQRRQLRSATAHLSEQGRREATRAAARGQRTPAMFLFGLLAVLDTITAIVSPSAWRWAGAAFLAAMIYLQVWWPRHLRRRLALLTNRT